MDPVSRYCTRVYHPKNSCPNCVSRYPAHRRQRRTTRRARAPPLRRSRSYQALTLSTSVTCPVSQSILFGHSALVVYVVCPMNRLSISNRHARRPPTCLAYYPTHACDIHRLTCSLEAWAAAPRRGPGDRRLGGHSQAVEWGHRTARRLP